MLYIIILCVDVLRYPSVANYDNLDYFRSRISIQSDGNLLAGAM